MRDISLHILDIAENSINADAENIEINIIEDTIKDLLTIEIIDDGKGIEASIKDRVTDPFVTSRTTRKVGLGLSLLKAAAETANGSLSIESTKGKGTKIKALFQMSHIDTKPLGDIKETLTSLIVGYPDVNVRFSHKRNGYAFVLDSGHIMKRKLQLKFNSGEILKQVKKQLKNYKLPEIK